MTVEPGIYIPDEGLAVRLEDDVLVEARQREPDAVEAPQQWQ